MNAVLNQQRQREAFLLTKTVTIASGMTCFNVRNQEATNRGKM